MNECRTIPGICGNGGRCLNTNGSYSCFCKSGHYGKNCETFDPCRSMPCINGGTCMANETFPYWQCACPRSYTGNVLRIIEICQFLLMSCRFTLRNQCTHLCIKSMPSRNVCKPCGWRISLRMPIHDHWTTL